MPKTTASPERRLIIRRQTHQGRYFSEALDSSTNLDMMQIPGGSFMMGQTEEEKAELIRLNDEEKYQQWYARELPRHSVTVPSFFLGKYPITQAQWAVVASYPKIEQDLESNPSKFKGANRPVEQVNWDDATEFCQRLSQHTCCTYDLPSEAQWEYACRSGTTTPFHYGETLSDELANYCTQDREIDKTLSNGVYGRGVMGQYRKETANVGQFPANSVGLYDMHGNVLEWCEDDYHSNYEGAPNDGSAWVETSRKDLKKLLRGGSWVNNPENCRSACRHYGTHVHRNHLIGFRVSCVSPSTPLSA
jgi:formylglycine-generating enzyme required for sulfatase activity